MRVVECYCVGGPRSVRTLAATVAAAGEAWASCPSTLRIWGGSAIESLPPPYTAHSNNTLTRHDETVMYRGFRHQYQ